MRRHPHRAHIFRDSFLPIDSEPRTSTNLRCRLSPPCKGAEHLLIDPSDLLPEVEHCVHIATILSGDILYGRLFEERINRRPICSRPEAFNSSRTTILAVSANAH